MLKENAQINAKHAASLATPSLLMASSLFLHFSSKRQAHSARAPLASRTLVIGEDNQSEQRPNGTIAT
jgi:hypothetical protein